MHSRVLRSKQLGHHACLWEEEGRKPEGSRLARVQPSLHVAQSHYKISQPGTQRQLRRVPMALPQQGHLQGRMQLKALYVPSTPYKSTARPVNSVVQGRSAAAWASAPDQMTSSLTSAPGLYSWQQAPAGPAQGPQGSRAQLLQAACTCNTCAYVRGMRGQSLTLQHEQVRKPDQLLLQDHCQWICRSSCFRKASPF